MVVECIGLPGSGKTYLFRSVAEELARKGISCVNVSDLIMHSLRFKAAKKVLHRVIFLDRDARRSRDRMRRILAQAGERPSAGQTGNAGESAGPAGQAGLLQSRYGINKDERFTVESAAIFAAAYRRMEKSKKVYLFDEGLVHTIVKFCAEFHLPDKVFLEMVEACGPIRKGEKPAPAASFDGASRIVVCNEISVQDCIESIQKRDRHVCAFDELPEDKLRELLGQYVRLNACYAARYPVLAVSRAEDEKEKCRRICGEILRKRA